MHKSNTKVVLNLRATAFLWAFLACFMLIFISIPANAQDQLVSIGFKGGIPFTDALSTPAQPGTILQYAQSTNRYVLGASVELHLPARFSVELDVLHSSFAYQNATNSVTQNPASWQFPLMAKYRIVPGAVQPYILGGVTFSRITNVSDLIALKNRSGEGIVLGGGVEVHLGPLKVSPELRYNNWTNKTFDISALQSNQNQLALLVGLTF